jgi:hypothetical protein
MGGGNGAKAAQKRERNAKDAKKDPQSQLKSVRIQLSFVRFDLSSILFGLRVLWVSIEPTRFFVALGILDLAESEGDGTWFICGSHQPSTWRGCFRPSWLYLVPSGQVLWDFTCRQMEFWSWKTVDLAIRTYSHGYIAMLPFSFNFCSVLRRTNTLFLISSDRLLTLFSLFRMRRHKVSSARFALALSRAPRHGRVSKIMPSTNTARSTRIVLPELFLLPFDEDDIFSDT